MSDSYLFRLFALFFILCSIKCCAWLFRYAKRRRATPKAWTEEDEAKAAEVKMKASLAAQQRQETFDKSEAGQVAREVAAMRPTRRVAAKAKPSTPPSQKGEPSLRQWHIMMG